MIQRIQTIYLALAALISGLTIFLPLATFKFNEQEFIFSVTGIKAVAQGVNQGVSTLPLLVLVIVIGVFCLAIIFLYKNRKLQMKLCKAAMLFTLFLISLFIFHIATANATEVSYSAALGLPLFQLIALMFAHRGIAKDENLVKSLDRIR